MPGGQAIAALRARAGDAGLGGLVVFNPVNLRYLTGFHSNAYSRPLALIVPLDGDPVLVVPHLEEPQARQMTSGVEVLAYIEWQHGARADGTISGEWRALLTDVLRERHLRGAPLGVERAALGVELGQALLAALPDVTLTDVTSWVEALRMHKTPEEIANHRRAAAIAAAGLDAAFSAAGAGATELEINVEGIRAALTDAVRRCPDQAIAVQGNALVGPRIAAIHAPARAVPARAGDLVFAVLLAAVDGSVCELSRTIVAGADPSPNQARLFSAVARAHAAAVAWARPGNAANDVDVAARTALGNDGLAAFLPMRTGHGIGFAGVEAPNLGAADLTPLEAGMVVSIEPGVCLPGVGGVLSADNYLITAERAERLTDYAVIGRD